MKVKKLITLLLEQDQEAEVKTLTLVEAHDQPEENDIDEIFIEDGVVLLSDLDRKYLEKQYGY
jgi:hypothetical protein